MLKARLLAAAVLLPAAIAWVLLSPAWLFAGVAAALVLGAAWEWGSLAGLRGPAARIVYLLGLSALLALSWYALRRAVWIDAVLWVALAFWVVSAFTAGRSTLGLPVGVRLVQGAFVLVPAFLGLLAVRGQSGGPGLAFALLGVVWAADAAAYFSGRAWGRHKLAPRISPGKSWEGLAGGLLGAVGAGALASLWCPVPLAVLIALAVGTALFSVVGDLIESGLKRSAGAKDSSRLIPGHGGLLDRIDSVTAAAPIFALGLELVRRGW